MTAERDTVADAVERLFRRIDRHVVEHGPVAHRPRGLHVAENAVTGERGFQQMASARVQCVPASSQRFARRLSGTVRRDASRDRIGIDHLHARNHVVRVRVDLPLPFGPATTWSVGIAGSVGWADQADFRFGGRITRSPSLVRGM